MSTKIMGQIRTLQPSDQNYLLMSQACPPQIVNTSNYISINETSVFKIYENMWNDFFSDNQEALPQKDGRRGTEYLNTIATVPADPSTYLNLKKKRWEDGTYFTYGQSIWNVSWVISNSSNTWSTNLEIIALKLQNLFSREYIS